MNHGDHKVRQHRRFLAIFDYFAAFTVIRDIQIFSPSQFQKRPRAVPIGKFTFQKSKINNWVFVIKILTLLKFQVAGILLLISITEAKAVVMFKFVLQLPVEEGEG